MLWIVNSDMRFFPSGVGVRVYGEFGKEGGPPAAERFGVLGRVGAEALQITVLQCHRRAAALGRHKGQLHFGEEVGIIGPLAVELPTEQQALRWLPSQHLAPVCFIAFGITLEPPAVDTGLQHDGDMRVLADSLSGWPPALHLACEQLEGARGRRLHGHALYDRRNAHSVLSSSVWRSTKSLKASSAANQWVSSQSRMAEIPRGSRR